MPRKSRCEFSGEFEQAPLRQDVDGSVGMIRLLRDLT
jgi:hypothetical protein